jgi:hypothetical protein
MTLRKSKFWSLLLVYAFFLAAIGIHPIPQAQATVYTVAVTPKFKAFEPGTGNPLASGKLYTYLPGTTTEVTTYKDYAGAASNVNPIILDANGECDLFYSGYLKLALYDAGNVLVWTKDNIPYGRFGALIAESISAPQIGSTSYTDNGYFSDLITKGPWVYDARSVNADNTGVADSYAAIVAALAAAPGCVLLPAGTYRTSASIEPPVYSCLIGIPHKTWIKPDAGVDNTLQLESSNYVYGISLDGINTTGKKGLVIGTALNDWTKVCEMDIKNYLGAGGVGFHIGKAVNLTADRIYATTNDIGLLMDGGTPAFPTLTTISNSHFRLSTNQGAKIITAQRSLFKDTGFESNNKEGVLIQPPVLSAIIGPNFDHVWIENNQLDNTSLYQFIAEAADIYTEMNIHIKNTLGSGTAPILQAIGAGTKDHIFIDGPIFETMSFEGSIKATISNIPSNYNFANILTESTAMLTYVGDQRAWTSYTPTFTPSGSMTLTGETAVLAKYKVDGKKLMLNIYATWTVGGTPSNLITLTIPSGLNTAVGGNLYVPLIAIDNNVNAAGWSQFVNNNINIYKLDTSNYTAGPGGVMINATVEIN